MSLTATAPGGTRGAEGPHVVVVGGGITGMAAAYAILSDARARSLGVRCTLVEQEPRLGGKLRTERINGCLIENGPDSFLAAKPWAADLCRALGLGDRLIGTTPGRAVYVAYRGRLHPIPEGMAFGVPTRLWPLVRSGLFSPAEKLRVAGDIFLPRRRDASDETIGAFVRRRLGNAVTDRLAGPLLGGIYAGDADALSLRATFPLLLEWEAAHRSLVLAALLRRRNAQAAGRGPSPMFLSLPGGLSEMVEALEQALDGRCAILTGRTARHLSLRVESGRATYTLRLDDGTRTSADALLLTTPAFAAAELLEPLAPQVASLLAEIPYVSTAALTLAYRREEIRHPLDGHGFVVARGEPLAITACTWVSSKWPHRAPPGIALLRCYLGAAGSQAVVEEDDARLVALARADLGATMAIDAEPAFARVTRWIRAMPQYMPGHLDRLATVEAGLKELPNLALAGAGYGGIGIPDCVRQGTQAASRLVEALAGRAPTLSGFRSAAHSKGIGQVLDRLDVT